MSKIVWDKKYCRRHNLYIVHRGFQGVSYFQNQRLSRYTHKCNFIFAHKQITAFPAPLLMKPPSVQHHHVSLLHKTSPIESTSGESPCQWTKYALTWPIFTKLTTTWQISISIFCTECYSNRGKMWKITKKFHLGL